MRSESLSKASVPRRRRASRRAAVAVIAALSPLIVAGCTPHHVALNYKCPGLTGHEVRVLSRRGAIGLGRMGVTPGGLKLLQKCQIN
jgi:hypothetical protein